FAWSGTLAAELTEVSPMNWMRGPDMLDAACESLRPQLIAHGRRLLLVPHARHVLSDARSALTWWSSQVIPGQELLAETRAPQGERPFGLAFDPAALLEPSMLPDLADHLRALFGSIGVRADAIVLQGWKPGPDADAVGMQPCAFDTGVLTWEHACTLLEEFIDPRVPVLVPGASVAAAMHAMNLG
ncbi:MAG: hypothetical protein JNK53_03940, partial [Phycisphaerae bacterium]|nr:hypothetical protein [Phycisphaerae bacterium]